VSDERERLLDPADRIAETLFGLIMAVTIVGSLSIATAGQAKMRTVTLAALGCNIAWGPVDAFMCLIRMKTERTRGRALARRIRGEDRATAHRLIVGALPESVAMLLGPDEIEAMRHRLDALHPSYRAVLQPRDYLASFGIFLLVVRATLPVVVPFFLTSDPALALHLSQAITLAMLFVVGCALGRHAGYEKSVRTGLAMAVSGAVLIVTVKALGG
jgi:VIT1/CCC1 family predicted Fe2+/Mn2+ transporter